MTGRPGGRGFWKRVFDCACVAEEFGQCAIIDA